MKKSALLLFAAFAAQAFSAELVCAPSFELIGLNPDFGKSSIRVLQGKMETKMNARQLLAPSSEESIAATDSESSQAAWAKQRGCSHLLQTTLTRLGETVQVSARLMDLNSNSYVFKKAYKANSPDDLHPIFQQLGNTLQDAKFASVETIYDVTSEDARSLAKKKSSTYWGLAVGASYYGNDIKEMYDLGIGYIWDSRTIIGEIVYNMGFNKNNNSSMEIGLRVLYPFSDKNSSLYIGGGAGFAMIEKRDYYYDYYDYGYEDDYGLLLEASAGYLIGRASTLIFRLEAYGDFLLYNSKTAGGGARFILGIN